MSKAIPGKVYKHFRNKKLYKIELLGTHSETMEDVVVYSRLHESYKKYWVRPLSMFEDKAIDEDGNIVDRFDLTQGK